MGMRNNVNIDVIGLDGMTGLQTEGHGFDSPSLKYTYWQTVVIAKYTDYTRINPLELFLSGPLGSNFLECDVQ